MTKKVIVNTES